MVMLRVGPAPASVKGVTVAVYPVQLCRDSTVAVVLLAGRELLAGHEPPAVPHTLKDMLFVEMRKKEINYINYIINLHIRTIHVHIPRINTLQQHSEYFHIIDATTK